MANHLLPECNHLLPSQHSAAFICILWSSLALCGIPFCITSHSIKSGNIFQAQMRQNADPASYRINTTFDTSHWLAFTRIFFACFSSTFNHIVGCEHSSRFVLHSAAFCVGASNMNFLIMHNYIITAHLNSICIAFTKQCITRKFACILHLHAS